MAWNHRRLAGCQFSFHYMQIRAAYAAITDPYENVSCRRVGSLHFHILKRIRFDRAGRSSKQAFMRLPSLGQDVRCLHTIPFPCGCNSPGRPDILARAAITPRLAAVEPWPKCNTVIWTWLCGTGTTLSRILNCHAGITARIRKKFPKARRFPRAANHQSPHDISPSDQ